MNSFIYPQGHRGQLVPISAVIRQQQADSPDESLVFEWFFVSLWACDRCIFFLLFLLLFLTCMFFDCEKKQENLARTHKDTRRTCQLYTAATFVSQLSHIGHETSLTPIQEFTETELVQFYWVLFCLNSSPNGFRKSRRFFFM